MRKLSLDETKRIELNILLEIDRICKENDLQYFLAYGTLLGAVRHKGFIPWDDDIDIQMPRDDYNKMIEIFDHKQNGHFTLIAPNHPRSRHSFVKIIDSRTEKIEAGIDYVDAPLGADVDIFPIDGQPYGDEKFEKWYDRLQLVYRLYFYTMLSSKGAIKKRLALPIIKLFFGRKTLKKIADKMHRKYPYRSSEYVGAIESCFNFRGNRVKKECYSDYITLEFEGHELRAPIGYHEILKKMYGDYMQLPPVEKQVTHHNNSIYFKTEYQNEKI